jgi:hypothetical protein
MSKRATAIEPRTWTSVPEKTDDLHFDAKNPRLAGTIDAEVKEPDILRTLWTEFAVDEVAISIAHNGFWAHEPILATKEDNKLVVIEGNRRLAAVKILRDPKARASLKATDLPEISKADIERLNTLPVVTCSREEVWQYLGFRHLNGPQNWRSFAKAEYIAQVHNQFGVPLATIAKQIGDQHSTVQRLYHGLMVLRQAEEANLFDQADAYKEHFSFSHLYTGLEYPGIAGYIGLKEERDYDEKDPVPKAKLKNLGNLLMWLYGSRSRGHEPLVRTQNPHLRMLDEALLSRDGITALQRGASLKISLDISRGDERLFREAMQLAKETLQDARGKLLQGYHGEEDLLRIAADVLDLSERIHEEMAQSRKNRKRKGV